MRKQSASNAQAIRERFAAGVRGENRQCRSKTDRDATFMPFKEDRKKQKS
jgi:hypothetical protein